MSGSRDTARLALGRFALLMLLRARMWRALESTRPSPSDAFAENARLLAQAAIDAERDCN